MFATAPVRAQGIRPDELARALDRRRARLDVDIRARVISANATAPGADVAMLEIGQKGFRLATADPLPKGAVFTCRVTLDDARESHMQARVAYCQPQPVDGQDAGYVSRLDFLAG